MNPALMNYLQSQQQTATNPQQVDNNFNPFDAGIQRAISSARESLGMTEKQQDKALRRSVLTFANNIAQQPKQRGFFNNFGSAARAMSPAIMEHDDYEEQALAQNNDLANQILAYKAAEENKQAAMEERTWKHDFAERQLAEQQNYRNMMFDLQRQKLNNQQGTLNSEVESKLSKEILDKFIPIQNKSEFIAYGKDKKAIGTVLEEFSNLEKNYKQFREDYENNAIDPLSPYSKVVNPAKDFFGKFNNNKKLRKETADRKTLDSRFKQFVIGSEQKLRGGGSLGPRLIQMFKDMQIYPELEVETPEIIESKLKMIKEYLENNYKASNFSLKYGLHIDPYEAKDFESMINPSAQNINVPQNEQNEEGYKNQNLLDSLEQYKEK